MTLSCVEMVEDSPSDAIKVGRSLPFSGELAASGINLERPLMMAADTINAAGGIQGSRWLLSRQIRMSSSRMSKITRRIKRLWRSGLRKTI